MYTNHKFLKFLLGLLIVFNSQIGKAQDTLYLSNGKTQVVKISEINDQNILYRFYNDSVSPLMYKENELINKIVLFNGYEYSFKPQSNIYQTHLNQRIWVNTIDSLLDSTSLLFDNDLLIDSIAKLHAIKNYNTKGLGGDVFLSTVFLTPIGGEIVLTIKNRKDITQILKIPDTKLVKSSKYVSSYQQNAIEIRKTRLSSSFAGGIISFVFLTGLFFNAFQKL